ncbi:CapA family protein [Roseovarius pacificus]|uniref:CapA family protein n=1 Tax=Roseovarius pacificus TaxID=337701 RepID=UPI002A18CD32|nr:CapA family protein [Roseovarius pacificus]
MYQDDRSARTGTIAWGGDVNIGRRFHYRFEHANARDALARITPLGSADLSIVNLECVVATRGAENLNKGERASFYFRARPEMLETLIRGNVDLVATANNHSGDYGPQALLEQTMWLDKAGIGQAGSGPDLEAALQPTIRRAGALDVALFSIDATQESFAAAENRPGIAWLDPRNPEAWRTIIEPRISEARKQADVVIVAMHWGANNRHAPDAREIEGGHALIDAGADAVVGASAHLLQGIEIYKNRPILHDAGDLLFDALSRSDNDSGVFTLDLDHRGVTAVRFTPLEIGFCSTKVLSGQAATDAVRRFARKCKALGVHLKPTGHGQGLIDLQPPERPVPALRTPPAVLEKRGVMAISAPRPEWLADDVPPDARFAEPLNVGPLELLGLRVSPERVEHLGNLAIESWWRSPKQVDCDWRIDFRVTSDHPAIVGDWGRSSSHDPCDWMWPLQRWTPGQIYRDFYTLRPSSVTNWLDSTLTLSVGLVSHQGKTDRVTLPRKLRFALSPKAGFLVLLASPAQYAVPTSDKISPTPVILWTAQQLQEITGGTWLVKPPEGWYVSSVTQKIKQLDTWGFADPKLLVAIDQRMAMRHELSDFTALKYWDNHDKLPSLQHKGAGAIVARPVEGLKPDFPQLQVPDPLHALIQLGAVARNRLKGRVVTVTGSAGKTSQCLMLKEALSGDGSVVSNSGSNYNSRVGMLHLLANTPEATDVVVLEAAVSAINAPKFQNIRLVRSDICIITNIAPSHMRGGEQGLETVARRKANIVEGMSKGGILLLNREIDCYEIFKERAAQHGVHLVTYGRSRDADVRLLAYDQTNGRVTAQLPHGQKIDYHITAPGLHMAMNSLAALAVKKLLGGPLKPFLAAMAKFQPLAGRGEIRAVDFAGKALTIVDESYNANPVSMRAAIATFGAMPTAGRRILILGDMLELGPDAPRYHQELAPQIRAMAPETVLLCGDLMEHLWNELKTGTKPASTGAYYRNAMSLLEDIDRHLQPRDTILLKASNSIGFGKILKHLSKADAV